jgi:hypothetical protein
LRQSQRTWPARADYQLAADPHLFVQTVVGPSEKAAMDTLNFDFERYSPQSRRDDGQSLAETNLSDVEVFMLRGRRLQAQTLGRAWRRAVARLRRLL